jgi:SAM-dependent MidA family methyltransferase
MAVGGPDATRPDLTVDLLDRIRSRADPSGWLPFDRFQELVLYAPGLGYYARPGLTRGAAGDYYTAPQLTPLFGRTLARRLLEEHRRLGDPDPFRVVEMGPGDGATASAIAAAWREAAPGASLELVLIEVEPSLLGPTAARVAASGGASVQVRVGSSIGAEAPLRGAVVANELLDALPVRRLVRRADGWGEQGVRISGSELRWEDRSPAVSVPNDGLPEVAEGTVVEISERASSWIRELSDTLVDGTAILLDYGDEESSLLQRFPAGSLRAVRGHRSRSDPLGAPGSEDLSTFVNFSRVRAAARRAGFREVAYRSQAEALGAWGLPQELAAAQAMVPTAEAKVRLQLAAKQLLFGFENFRVLELSVP